MKKTLLIVSFISGMLLRFTYRNYLFVPLYFWQSFFFSLLLLLFHRSAHLFLWQAVHFGPRTINILNHIETAYRLFSPSNAVLLPTLFSRVYSLSSLHAKDVLNAQYRFSLLQNRTNCSQVQRKRHTIVWTFSALQMATATVERVASSDNTARANSRLQTIIIHI